MAQLPAVYPVERSDAPQGRVLLELMLDRWFDAMGSEGYRSSASKRRLLGIRREQSGLLERTAACAR